MSGALAACALLLYAAMPPAPGAPLWTHRITIDVDRVWVTGATESWSPRASLAAVADDTAAVMSGEYLPMTPALVDAQCSAQDARDAAVMDAIERELHVGAEALFIIACAILGEDPADVELPPTFDHIRQELCHV